MADHERCEACGFEGAVFDDVGLLVALRSLGERWQCQLADAGPDLRVRPVPGTWSAIEYAAHSRDVTVLHAYGVKEALTRDEPIFPDITGDQLNAAASTYADADPRAVVGTLGEAAEHMATSPKTPVSARGLGASPLASHAATCADSSSTPSTTPTTTSATSNMAWPSCEPTDDPGPSDPPGDSTNPLHRTPFLDIVEHSVRAGDVESQDDYCARPPIGTRADRGGARRARAGLS